MKSKHYKTAFEPKAGKRESRKAEVFDATIKKPGIRSSETRTALVWSVIESLALFVKGKNYGIQIITNRFFVRGIDRL